MNLLLKALSAQMRSEIQHDIKSTAFSANSKSAEELQSLPDVTKWLSDRSHLLMTLLNELARKKEKDPVTEALSNRDNTRYV